LRMGLKDKDWDVRTIAAMTILQLIDPADKEALQALAKGLEDNDPDNREGTLWMLKTICLQTPSAVFLVEVGLRDPNRDVRLSAASVFRDLGAVGKAALPALLKALRDPDYSV